MTSPIGSPTSPSGHQKRAYEEEAFFQSPPKQRKLSFSSNSPESRNSSTGLTPAFRNLASRVRRLDPNETNALVLLLPQLPGCNEISSTELAEKLEKLDEHYDTLQDLIDDQTTEGPFFTLESLLSMFALCHSIQKNPVDDLRSFHFKSRTLLIGIYNHLTPEEKKQLQCLFVDKQSSENLFWPDILEQFCKKSYISLEGQPVKFISEEDLLNHVIARTEEDLLNPSHLQIDLVREVHAFALGLLSSVKEGNHVGVNSYFHAVRDRESLFSILDDKISVRHELALPGAFVSSQFEEGFGDVGVVVSAQTIVAKSELDHLQRRPDEDGASVWVASTKEGLTPVKTRAVLADTISPNTRKSIKEKLPKECIAVEVKVHEKFNQYVREINDLVPLPKGVNSLAIAHNQRGKENE